MGVGVGVGVGMGLGDGGEKGPVFEQTAPKVATKMKTKRS